MTVLAQLLTAAALVATAVIYGTDVFAAAVLAMAAWLLIYRSVSAPVNRQLTAAAHDGRTPGVRKARAPGADLAPIS
jgi:hypothetical protein